LSVKCYLLGSRIYEVLVVNIPYEVVASLLTLKLKILETFTAHREGATEMTSFNMAPESGSHFKGVLGPVGNAKFLLAPD
jgi:hypothetical protein